MSGSETLQQRKRALGAELVEHVTKDLETLERAQAAVREAATHEEAKPENDKDTRALEQSYLARGQAARVEELRAVVAELAAMSLRIFGEGSPAAIGALVTLEEDEAEHTYFLVPHGGGVRLEGGAVLVVTTKSPLGQAILGKRAGDSFELQLGGKLREFALTSVR